MHLPLPVITSTSTQPHCHFPNAPPCHDDTHGSTTASRGREDTMSPRNDNHRGSLRLYDLARVGRGVLRSRRCGRDRGMSRDC